MRLIDADAIEYESGSDPKDPCADMAYVTAESIDAMPTIPDINRSAILRLCNEIEDIACNVYNTGSTMQNCDYDGIFKRLKAIEDLLTGG